VRVGAAAGVVAVEHRLLGGHGDAVLADRQRDDHGYGDGKDGQHPDVAGMAPIGQQQGREHLLDGALALVFHCCLPSAHSACASK